MYSKFGVFEHVWSSLDCRWRQLRSIYYSSSPMPTQWHRQCQMCQQLRWCEWSMDCSKVELKTMRPFFAGASSFTSEFCHWNGLELSHDWPSEQLWIMKIVILSFKSGVENYTKVDMHQTECDGRNLPRVDIYIALIFWLTRKMKLKYILTQAGCHKIICPSFNPSRLHALLICQLEYEGTLTKRFRTQ